MQDYKSLPAAVTICATMVNIQTHTQIHRQTHRQHFDQLIWIAEPTELKRDTVNNRNSTNTRTNRSSRPFQRSTPTWKNDDRLDFKSSGSTIDSIHSTWENGDRRDRLTRSTTGYNYE